jgi:hypothetical protein
MRVNYSPDWRILGTLCAILLVVYLFLKGKILNNGIMSFTFNLAAATEISNYLRDQGMNENLTKWMTAQAAHETGGFSSSIYKSNNNVYGMKYAGQITAQGEKNGYANYTTVKNSVIDFVKWYNRRRRNLLSLPLVIFSIEDYVRFLKNNNYFEASEIEYLTGCKYFYNLLFNG